MKPHIEGEKGVKKAGREKVERKREREQLRELVRQSV